jgi:hypothetical protein
MRLDSNANDKHDKHSGRSERELAIYRKTTVAVLRKFLRMSLELGHLPSLLGRQFFRTHVTSYTTYTFEDAVIFTHDVERCLHLLPPRLREVLAHVVFEEYSAEETAGLMRVSARTAFRWYSEALDRVAEIFLRHGLMQPIKIAQTPWEPDCSSHNDFEPEDLGEEDECRAEARECLTTDVRKKPSLSSARSAAETENELPPRKNVSRADAPLARALEKAKCV